MNNVYSKVSPFCVNCDDFNLDFIMNLGCVAYLKIVGNYSLSKSDYDNLVIYSNVVYVEVYDVLDFEFGGEIELCVSSRVSFNSDRYKKYDIDKFNGYNKDVLSINLPFSVYFSGDYLFNEEDDFSKLLDYLRDITVLNINFDDVNVVDSAIDVVLKIEDAIGHKIKSINCITGNRTINDIEKFKFLESDRVVKIWYEDGITDCSIDEFILMRNRLDHIVSSVKAKSLSPFESVIYVYDIVKKFNYKSSDSMDGRQLHKVFGVGGMVCSGFSRVISEVLNELGIRSCVYKLITNNGLHARSLVHIIDNKYHINGIYSMEPTWESMLNVDSSYGLFLTPINKLKKFFPNDRFRCDIDVLCGNMNIDDIPLRDKISLYRFFDNKDLSQDYIDSVIKSACRYASLEDFCKALVNVRVVQNSYINVVDVVNYNNRLVNYLNVKMGTNINFFK